MGGNHDLDRLAAAGHRLQRGEAVADLAVERGGKTRAHTREALGEFILKRHPRSFQRAGWSGVFATAEVKDFLSGHSIVSHLRYNYAANTV